MSTMPFTVGWYEVALRLAVTLVAGTLIGLNRGGSGKIAGLRTTLLVCLAASLAMLQVNILLSQSGKPDDSFVMLDLMRLPLGILSGVGFIGAGAILRKDGLVTGVTTAATLWFVTVIGLCAGGGQIALALEGLVLGLIVLWILGKFERILPRGKRAWLTVVYDPDTHDRSEMIGRLKQQRCQVNSSGLQRKDAGRLVEERFDIYWRAPEASDVVEREMASIVGASRHAASWSIEE